MSKVENGCCIIDAMSGIDTASPQINCFTDNFNSIKFLMSGIFSDYTIMIITDINGHVEIVNTDGNMLTKSTNSSTNTTTLTWKPGKEITSASGVVVYQIAAYKPNGDSIESVWYSKEGRLVVSESIDTTSHSAEVLGTGPNLLTRLLLEMAQVKESVENLDLTKVDKVDGKELSDENYSLEEKEKLSGIETGAEVNIQSDWEEIDETSDSYIKNKPIIDINYDSESENAQSGKAVAQAIAKLVNGSPEALDTLHELANALGNDENFSATVMEAIAKKTDQTYINDRLGEIKEAFKLADSIRITLWKKLAFYSSGEYVFATLSGGNAAIMEVTAPILVRGSDTPPDTLPDFETNFKIIYTFGDYSVDQSYNADSENAQSGKAVAEAIDKIVSASPDGGYVIIDQSYNALSENAQSGKAVAEAIANLVNGSPEALDTLHELANALGNDENFSATVMEKIGKKADAASLEEVKSDIARILDGRTTVSKASSDSLGNNIVLHYATKEEVTTQIGDIETALDGIITIQNGILGVGVNE
ncbi:MAG: hypothetical protein J6B23_09080 [Clostridia bacterium]|nr:hypothetical protein [Clostridia bacterium]